MKLADLLKPLEGMTRQPLSSRSFPDTDVRGLTYDSRHTAKGDLFIALQGLKRTGTDFAADAIAKGAVAVRDHQVVIAQASFGSQLEPEPVLLKVSQATLAEMVGTTRSRVSFFMNRFRELGFIDYNGTLQVHPSLLTFLKDS